MKYEARNLPAAEAKADVLRLWGERPAGGDEALFRWGYLTNPVGPVECFLLRAVDASGATVVGAVGVGARRVAVGRETLSAAILGDFFVEKAHRTFFPALILQRAVLGWAQKRFDLVYGFPNGSAKPLIKKLGFRDMANLERHVLVLRHARYLASRLRSATFGRVLAVPIDAVRRFAHPRIAASPRRGLVFARVDALDERFDRLFRARAFRTFTVGFRDAKLLRWRFLERPNQPCSLYTLGEPGMGELRGYAVVNVADDVAHVRDLLGIDVSAMTEVLLHLANEMYRQGCVALSFMCAAPPELKERLARLGFRVRDGNHGARTLYGHTGASLAASDAAVRVTPRQLDHWYATEADEDQ